MAFQAINLSIAQSGRDLSGKYEKGKRIGRGASSDVWYGRLHTDMGDVEIAVKELQVQHYSMQDSSSPQHEYLIKRCLKEVLTVENVKHPNIVPLLGYSIDSQGVPALITPWYSYGNVIKYLEAQPSANLLALALDAAEGLKYLHSIGVIHGDIHGENLLVDSSGRASLCDLGISQFIEDAILVTGLTTSHANAGGTDRFSSPEVLQDQPKTLATDIWAFGCLVAQILTGRIPYGKIVRKYAIHAAINKGESPMENQDGKIGGILWECLRRCWSHEPNLRPMVSEICSHLAGEGLSSTTAQGIEDMGSPHRDDMARLDLSGKIDFGERYNRSGYSDIWRGKLRTNAGVVEIAIKELRIHRASTSGGSMTQEERLNRRCRREVLLWQKLQHRNIVPLLGFASDPRGVPTLVSPWYANGNVVEYLNLHPNANRRSLSIDVGSGLEYLHSIGVVHGDLKGENVLVDVDGRASLCDFGMSKFLDAAARITGCTTSHANGGGTNRFLAPELLDDQLKTLETDMWAFGCVVSQIITGCIPYEEITQTMAVVLAINNGQLPMINQDGKIEEPLWDCLVKCWSKAPSDRPSISQLCSQLRIIGPEPSSLVIPQDFKDPIMPLDLLNLSDRINDLTRRISSGYADVFRGTMPSDTGKMEVAIKYLRLRDSAYHRSSTTPEERLKKRFFREITLWKDLKHPNIVPFLGFTTDSQGALGLVSPWYHNGNVLQYLQFRPNVPRQHFIQEVLEGLEYLHSLSMVHGDLKGDNVLIRDDGHATLCDFGLSHFLDEALHARGFTTSQAYTGGTERFMSPELIEGGNKKTLMSDMWAFGCLAAQIATGTLPYNDQSSKLGVALAIRQGVPPMKQQGRKIDGVLWKVIDACWMVNPADRPTATELRFQLLGTSDTKVKEMGTEGAEKNSE